MEEHDRPAQFGGTPKRRYYTGGNLERTHGIADLRARAHRLMPRFVLEYLEGGAEDEATLKRERAAYGEWRFVPRQLVDVSHRSIAAPVLGRAAPMPLAISPTGLNGLFMRGGDTALAQGAARFGVPFTQGTMSNDRMEDVARVPGLRHWWQLYIFGGDEIWQELVRRAESCGVEALLVTTNAQIYGDREWEARVQVNGKPTPGAAFDAARHWRWATTTLDRGMPEFANVIDFVPKERRRFFDSATWIREQMRKSLSWDDIARIRDRWKGRLILKGLLHPDDIRRALDAGVDGIALGTHGGRQEDWSVVALDVLEEARGIVGDRMALLMSGGIRRGTDMLKALALGADAVLTGRATLYGLCAGGADGVHRALELLHDEALDGMGQIGVKSLDALDRSVLAHASSNLRQRRVTSS
ncbi:alpha-hydroxy acid oxidase [Sphingomonas sp.]|uniref:alpha-hydroxy acid oxidase n=1 Tax=Sphingomonas sp. TaxID=28214 RepID=UPI003B00D999